MKDTYSTCLSLALCIASLLLILSLTACGALPSNPTVTNVQKPSKALGNAEYYTHELADELFAALLPDRQYRYAVAGFVPVDSLQQNPSSQSPIMLLGHQLEQGLITEAVKRGFIAQDYKVSNSIIMNDMSDRVLTRDLNQLSQIQRIDFFITGTITSQETGAIVNARVIDARNKDVVAAATQYFPNDLFWSSETVTQRNGRLYRSEHFMKEVDL